MRVSIFYFSSTGNTKFEGELVKKGFEDRGVKCELICITDKVDNECVAYDLIGFASPVFNYKPSLCISEFIKKLPQQECKPCFMVLTHAGLPLGAFNLFSKQLKKKGFLPIAHFGLVCENSWTVLRFKINPSGLKRPTLRDQSRIKRFGKILPDIYEQFTSGNFTQPHYSWMKYFVSLRFSFFYQKWFLSPPAHHPN